MRRLIIVHGLKRSGNHAIINWLKPHDKFIFVNNIIPIAPILNGNQTIPPPIDFKHWFCKILLPHLVIDSQPDLNLDYFTVLDQYQIRDYSLIVSLEDHQLTLQPFTNIPCDTINLLIIRSASNLFSSRIRKAQSTTNPAYPKSPGAVMDRIISLWKKHVREHLNYSNILQNKVSILFDYWFEDSAYRNNISKQLGYKFTDVGFSSVSSAGGGSSFDGTKFDGKNEMMSVLDRKKSLSEKEKKLLNRILEDSEIQSLSEKL